MTTNKLIKQPPILLQPFAEQRLDALNSAIDNDLSPELLQQFLTVIIASDYFFEQTLKSPHTLSTFAQDGFFANSYCVNEQNKRLNQYLESTKTTEQLNKKLREFRREEMLRIIWRDILHLSDLNETMKDLSTMADACINQALAKLQTWHLTKIGASVETVPPMSVLALGKLGGDELNLSSDVDLLFIYPADNTIKTTNHNIPSQQFFIQLGQELITTLNAITADGFVFRVDMRLRPYGTNGSLAMSLDALKDYYIEQGRDWERYALIKARPINKNHSTNKQLINMLHDFVYRRYIDFTAMQSLRNMKELIRQQVLEKGLEHDIKQGSGGIREIEFIAQTLQLIHGGEDRRLRKSNLLNTLTILKQHKYLNADIAIQLEHAYVFLRTLEHRLQAIADKQTHRIPTDELTRARIAYSLGYDDWENLNTQLNKHQQFVIEQFEAVIDKSHKIRPNNNLIKWDGLTTNIHETNDAKTPKETSQSDLQITVNEWLKRLDTQDLSRIARKRLDNFLPHLLYAVTACDIPKDSFDRVMHVIDAVLKRSVYLVLLEENPKALEQLVKLCSKSKWICEQMALFPRLLGELLDETKLYLPINTEHLTEELNDQLTTIDKSDKEQVLEILRRFKRRQELRIAAADICDVFPIMKVSDHLTNVAVVILTQVLNMAWDLVITEYGHPKNPHGKLCNTDFTIVAYGKLGGIELGYGSDLDLVFLHNADDKKLTNGKKKVTGTQFFSRLTQEILNILNIQTDTGHLYDVDTRLKPSGQAGMLVSSFDAFAEYQTHNAWVWEHQALVRARVVAGDKILENKFEKLRRNILSKPQDEKKLREEICDMRQRMCKEAKRPPKGKFDLKQGRGGITDIEFIAQYTVLAWSNSHPELLIYPDNIRILETCESADLISRKDVDLLCNAYRTYRNKMHHLRLQYQPDLVDDTMFPKYRRSVQRIWNKILKLR